MIKKLVIPKELGESIEVRLLGWLKQEGEQVNAGDAVLEFETDKAIVLVTASESGTLRKCLFTDGDWVKPGDATALLSDGPDETLPDDMEALGDLTVTFEVT